MNEQPTPSLPNEISRILTEVLSYSGSFRLRFSNEPMPGSLAASELASAEGEGCEDRLFDIRAAYQKAVAVLNAGAGQHMWALTQLYQPQMALFGYQVVTRALVETSARAWWLLDPNIDTTERLGRLYVDNMENISEMGRADRLGVGENNMTSKRIEMLIARAAKIGLTAEFSKKGDELIGFNSIRQPDKTPLVREFFDFLGLNNGGLWYRQVSAITHGTAYGLLDYFDAVSDPAAGLVRLEPRLPAISISEFAIIASEAYLGSIEAHSQLFGWDSQDVSEMRSSFKNQIANLFEEPS